jgi:hypothetical protein
MFNGKEVTLTHRKYCTKCSPIGERKIWGGKETYKIRFGESYKRKILNPIFHICKTCGREHTVKSRNTECSTCRSGRIRLEKKQKAVDLLGGKCQVCGYNKCNRALAFHHTDIDEKSFNLSWSWSKSWNELEKELKKCILLCNRCHEEMHDGLIDIDALK